MAEREVVLKLILDTEGAKIPPIDTKAADESIRQFVERAKRALQELTNAARGAGFGIPGGMAIPGASTSAAEGAGVLPQGFKPYRPAVPAPYQPAAPRGPIAPTIAPTVIQPTYGPQAYPPTYRPRSPFAPMAPPAVSPVGARGWAHGPISDPGSYAVASQPGKYHYDYAMRMQSMAMLPGIQDRMGGGTGREFQQARIGLSQMRESIGGLAASIALANMQIERGVKTWGDLAGVAASVFSTGVYGVNAAQGAYRAGRGAVQAGGRILTGARNAGLTVGSVVAGGLIERGLIGGTMGARLAGLAGSIGGGTILGAGAAVGTAGYLGYQYLSARSQVNASAARGRELDSLIYDTNLSRAQRREFDRIGGIGTAAERMARAGAFDSIRGGPDFFQRSNNASTQIRRNIAGLEAGRDAAAAVGNFQKAAEYSRQIERSEQARLQLSQQRLEVMEREGRLLLEQVQMQSNLAQTTRSNAQAVASAAGRIGPSGRAQLRNLARRPLNERNALAIEGITGYREGSPQSEFLNRLGQQQIDDPALRPFFGNQARTSTELGKLDKEIADLKTKEQNIVERLEQVIIDRQEVMIRFADAIENAQRQTEELLQRMNNQDKANTQRPAAFNWQR